MRLHSIDALLTPQIGLRFLLGFFESGLYPGIVFYISWYATCLSQTAFIDANTIFIRIAGTNARSLAPESPFSFHQQQSLAPSVRAYYFTLHG